jgi:putative hydrolase of the HAD superfamily
LAVTARIALVITALDGTLLDHERAARDAVCDWVATRGWQSPRDAAAQWLRLEREHFAECATFYESHWVAFDDVRAVLGDLAAAGYVLGVLTNGQRDQQLAKFARVGLLDRFAGIVASSELPAGNRTRGRSPPCASGWGPRPGRSCSSAMTR